MDVFLYCVIPWYLCDLHVLSIWVEAAPRPRSHWVGITLGYDPALTSELCGVEYLGSKAHYSISVWIVLCEELICQCVHLCVLMLCLFGTPSFLPPTQLDIMCCGYSVLLIHQQLRFKCPEPPIKSNQPIKLPRLWGQIRASVRFYWPSPMSAREFSSM